MVEPGSESDKLESVKRGNDGKRMRADRSYDDVVSVDQGRFSERVDEAKELYARFIRLWLVQGLVTKEFVSTAEQKKWLLPGSGVDGSAVVGFFKAWEDRGIVVPRDWVVCVDAARGFGERYRQCGLEGVLTVEGMTLGEYLDRGADGFRFNGVMGTNIPGEVVVETADYLLGEKRNSSVFSWGAVAGLSTTWIPNDRGSDVFDDNLKVSRWLELNPKFMGEMVSIVAMDELTSNVSRRDVYLMKKSDELGLHKQVW